MDTREVTHKPSRVKPRHHPAQEAIEAYAGDDADELPIGGYATMIAVFMGSFVGLVAAARRADVLPRRVPIRDIALLGVATHTLTRIVTRERVTIPLRVPFTHYEGRDGAGQVLLRPAAPGTGVIAGGAVRAVLESAGIQDVLSKCIGTSNKNNVVHATVAALRQLRTAERVARGREKQVDEVAADYPVAAMVARGIQASHHGDAPSLDGGAQ